MAWITFSYDDGMKNNYDIALPLHEKYNIPASLAIIANRAVNPEYWDKFMSPIEIVKAAEKGHEIVSHGYFHTKKFTDLTDDDLEYELLASKNVLNGFVSNEIESINIPFAAYDDRVLKRCLEHYKRVRLANDRLNECCSSDGLIYAYGLNSNTSVNRVKKLIDKSINEKKWIVLMLHGIEKNLIIKVNISIKKIFWMKFWLILKRKFCLDA